MKPEKKNIKNFSVALFLVTLFGVYSCGQNNRAPSDYGDSEKHKVTFIELGSVRCIPCQQMQAVMKSIETKYGKEVKIDFHDVWTEAGKPFGVKYGIESIPTQVFLDETGKEFFRHVGYFPEEELVKVLQIKGVKPI